MALPKTAQAGESKSAGMEELTVQNLLIIKNVCIVIKPVTIIIGPQASGKSIITKLLYFLKKANDFFLEAVFQNKTPAEYKKFVVDKFKAYFPFDGKYDENMKIKYKNDDFVLVVTGSREGSLAVNFSDNYSAFYAKARNEYLTNQNRQVETDLSVNRNPQLYHSIQDSLFDSVKNIAPDFGYSQIYIPAGRAFFSLLQKNIFQIIKSDNLIDQYMLEFGSWYETFKSIGEKILNGQTSFDPKTLDTIKKIISAILDGNYHYEKETVYIYNKIGKLNIANCSSGQQELLPLLLVIGSLPFYRFTGEGVSIYIEEPEVHLFPDCQKAIMDLLFYTFNHKRGKCQYFITTHSPYIISSINLALQANEYVNKMIDRNDDFSEKEKDFKMDYSEIAAYSVVDGCSARITNDEYRLIETGLVDKISDALMEKYAFYTETVNG
jgi:hypothetical protein